MFQNNIFQKSTISSFYILNLKLHTDLKIKTVHEITFYKKFRSRLTSHTNLATLTIFRRIKENWCHKILNLEWCLVVMIPTSVMLITYAKKLILLSHILI
ncbi:putative RNA-directed DNA polymerase, partial [Aphis craccivora]